MNLQYTIGLIANLTDQVNEAREKFERTMGPGISMFYSDGAGEYLDWRETVLQDAIENMSCQVGPHTDNEMVRLKRLIMMALNLGWKAEGGSWCPCPAGWNEPNSKTRGDVIRDMETFDLDAVVVSFYYKAKTLSYTEF